MENFHELTLLHFLEIWFKMENLYEITPLHFLEIWFKIENLYEQTPFYIFLKLGSNWKICMN